MIKQHFHALILAFQFLTRLPLHRLFAIANTMPSPQVAGKALLYYPVVGGVIGVGLIVLPVMLLRSLYIVCMLPICSCLLLVLCWYSVLLVCCMYVLCVDVFWYVLPVCWPGMVQGASRSFRELPKSVWTLETQTP